MLDSVLKIIKIRSVFSKNQKNPYKIIKMAHPRCLFTVNNINNNNNPSYEAEFESVSSPRVDSTPATTTKINNNVFISDDTVGRKKRNYKCIFLVSFPSLFVLLSNCTFHLTGFIGISFLFCAYAASSNETGRLCLTHINFIVLKRDHFEARSQVQRPSGDI